MSEVIKAGSRVIFEKGAEIISGSVTNIIDKDATIIFYNEKSRFIEYTCISISLLKLKPPDEPV